MTILYSDGCFKCTYKNDIITIKFRDHKVRILQFEGNLPYYIAYSLTYSTCISFYLTFPRERRPNIAQFIKYTFDKIVQQVTITIATVAYEIPKNGASYTTLQLENGYIKNNMWKKRCIQKTFVYSFRI